MARKDEIKELEPVVTEPVVAVEVPSAPKVIAKEIEIPKPTNPALYMCHVQCWLGTKKRFVNPGEVVEFYPGEYIPDFFTPL